MTADYPLGRECIGGPLDGEHRGEPGKGNRLPSRIVKGTWSGEYVLDAEERFYVWSPETKEAK